MRVRVSVRVGFRVRGWIWVTEKPKDMSTISPIIA